MKSFKNKGFTLIELMLVITIIMIILGFMIPKFYSYQEKARETKALNTAKQIQTAAMASYGEKDGNFDKDEVTKAIKNFTTTNLSSVVPSGDGQVVDVVYVSDKKDCKVTIKAMENTCDFKYDSIKDNSKQDSSKEDNKINKD